MKRLVAIVFACSLLCAPAAVADEASKNAKIEELLKLTNGEKMMGQVFDQIKSLELAQMNKMDIPPQNRERVQQMQQRVLQLLQDSLSWDKLKPMVMKIYADTFSEEEIDGILNFYRSAAGQAMLEKMPALMQRSMAMAQQMMNDVMPQIQKMIDEMKAQEKSGAAPPAAGAPPQ
jgi:uncharacterized protein